MQNTTLNILKTVVKTSEKGLYLKLLKQYKSSYKSESRIFYSQLKSHITKRLSTSISLNIRIIYP